MTRELTVRSATQSDIPALAGLLARAFVDDPEMSAIVPPPDERLDRLSRMFSVQAQHHYLEYGAIDLAFGEDELLGAAMWASPGHAVLPARALTKLAAPYAAALGPHLLRGLRAERAAQRFHPRYEHWYLYVIGTAPNAQGRGVGRALLERGITRADHATAACYLEATTPRSAALYSRLGFIPLGTQPGGTTGMWRPVVHPTG